MYVNDLRLIKFVCKFCSKVNARAGINFAHWTIADYSAQSICQRLSLIRRKMENDHQAIDSQIEGK